MTHLQDAIRKQAGATSTMLADAMLDPAGGLGLGTVFPGAGGTAPAAVHNYALLAPGARKDVRTRGHILKSLIPLVGKYRQGRVQRAVAEEAPGGVRQLWHERTGSAVGPLLGGASGAALGAGVGRMLDEDATALGAGVGAGIGFLAPNIAAALLALSTKRRTNKEQAKHERSNVALNYIPGVGAYNLLKRTGHGYNRYFGKKEKAAAKAKSKQVAMKELK